MKTYVRSAREAATVALETASLLEAAEEIQWKPSPSPAARFDTSERALGGIQDPTAATALDERRLALRDAVQKAEAALRDATSTLATRRGALQAAIDAWHG